jgi:hypothetical protein
MRSTLATLTKQTMGRVRRRTSTKQRSITLVYAGDFTSYILNNVCQSSSCN